MNTHEDYTRGNEVQGSSNRSFGFVFASFFALLAVLPYLHGRKPVRLRFLAVSAAFLIVALVWARALSPLNKLWTRFAQLLSKITTPIFAGLIFYLAITPFALVLRLAGKDSMKRRLDPGAKSYWIDRQPPGPSAESMVHQF